MKAYKIISKIARWIWPHKFSYLYNMKVKFNDTGETIEVPGYTELVTWMRENSHDQESTNKEYMLNYARRAVLLNNEDIRAVNEIEFVEYLVDMQHIAILN